MAVRILTETLNNQTNVLPDISAGIAGTITGGVSIHVNHVVDFSKPLRMGFGNQANFDGNSSEVSLNKSFWDSINIQEGDKVTACVVKTQPNVSTSTTIIYVNGGLCPNVSTGADNGVALNFIRMYEVSDVVIMTGTNRNTVYDSYTMSKKTLHTVEGQFTEEQLQEGYVTSLAGVTTAKVSLSPNAAIVQLEHRARLNRTSSNSATSSVKVQIGTKSETRTLPLLGFPSKALQTIIIPVVLSEEPDNVVTDLSYTLNLTHQ